MKNLILLLSILIWPLLVFSQNLEVEGKAKISVMNSDPAAENIVVRQADGTLAVRDAGTLTDADNDPTNELELPQSPNLGQMNYWNGTAWVSVNTGIDGQSLFLCNGVPTWTTNGVCPPPSVTSANGRVWMDRNLGATQVATSSTDAAAYGDLYQWGRGPDGHQIRTSPSRISISSTDQPGHGDFIIGNQFDWRSEHNNNLWQGLNGVNNPCPSGYRLPTRPEWTAEGFSWNTSDAAGAFNSPLKLVKAGGRNGWITDELFDVGTVGYYWSSTVAPSSLPNHSRTLEITNTNYDLGGLPRILGLSVRCIRDY